MKLHFISILLFIFYTTFVIAQKDEFIINGKKQKVTYPPGMTKIDDNFYADEAEVSNINYLEYLFWLADVYGSESDIYQTALPDTLVWLDSLEYNEPFVETYLRHPAYANYPVVGISLAQAQDYSKWRSDRVYEISLVKEGLLIYDHEDRTPENHFTIDRLLNGDYSAQGLTVDMVKHIPIPQFKIPTPEEWEMFNATPEENTQYQHDYAIFGISAKQYQKASKKGYDLFNIIDVPSHLIAHDNASITAPSYSYYPNCNNLYNTIGNVAELTTEEGIAKGGSWVHTLDKSYPSLSQEYEMPTAWLGFRCVCSWRFLDDEL